MAMEKALTAEALKDIEYPLVAMPWKGDLVLVRARRLSQIQIMSCGSFSLIDFDKGQKPFTFVKWAEFAKTRYQIMKESLVSPTYREIFDIIHRGDLVESSEREFRELGVLIESLPRGPKRQELEEQHAALLCHFRYIFPEDFIAALISYALSQDVSDIAKVTREMLLTAAILAKEGGDNPADHIKGCFTDFNREDINLRAMQVLSEEKEKRAPRKATKPRKAIE